MTRDSRLPALTGLRWAAALVVFGQHTLELFYDSDLVAPRPVRAVLWALLVNGGAMGVSFFFVLSGFVLAWTYIGGMPSLRVFYWRRFARIWPLHAVATLLSTGVYLLLGVAVPLTAVLAALGLVHAWVPDSTIIRGGNGATWSLSDEAFFYLCFPLVLAILSRFRKSLALATAGLAIVALGTGWALVQWQIQSPFYRSWLLDYFPPVRLLQFIVGVALGVAVSKGWRPRVPMSLAIVLVLGYHLALIPWQHHISDRMAWGPYSASQLLAVPVFSLLVLAGVRRDLEGRSGILGHPWALRLGHWSFAWYLVHEIVLRSFVAWRGKPEGLLATAAMWVVVLVCSQAFAGLLYHVVEHPTERRLRGLVRPRSRARALV